MKDCVSRARELAYIAHADQEDKAGQPYIHHVARVAATVSFWPEAEAVAWLHDVMEDCPSLTDEVRSRFPDEVYWACFLLDRGNASTDKTYYNRIHENRLAFIVKLADIHDNSNERRLAALGADTADRLRHKYTKARQALGV